MAGTISLTTTTTTTTMTTFNPPAGTKLNVIIDSSLQGEGKRIQYYWVYLVDQSGATREGRLRVNADRFEFGELVSNVISEGRLLDNGNFTCSMPSQPTPQPEPEKPAPPCPEGRNEMQDLANELKKDISRVFNKVDLAPDMIPYEPKLRLPRDGYAQKWMDRWSVHERSARVEALFKAIGGMEMPF